MRIAWFRATAPDTGSVTDETAPVIAGLRGSHHLDIVTETEAHDFVWRHFREPYNVCVYELGSTPAHQFLRAYLPHYPGIIAPHGLGVRSPVSQPRPTRATRDSSVLALGLLDVGRTDIAHRAVARARAAGIHIEVISGEPAHVLDEADVILATPWPPTAGAPTAALLGMAAQKAVVVMEVESTAAWAAFDPQTWQPRGWSAEPPIVISIDPRDEEHSLLIAFRRLASDARLRENLAASGHRWWSANATIAHAVRAWEVILQNALTAGPAGLRGQGRQGRDHSDGVRATLAEFGVSVDFLVGDASQRPVTP